LAGFGSRGFVSWWPGGEVEIRLFSQVERSAVDLGPEKCDDPAQLGVMREE
jgi:hypothetical protein